MIYLFVHLLSPKACTTIRLDSNPLPWSGNSSGSVSFIDRKLMLDSGASYYHRDSILYYFGLTGAEVATLVLWATAKVKQVSTAESTAQMFLL